MPEPKPSIPPLPPVVRITLPTAEAIADALALMLAALPSILPERCAALGPAYNELEARIAEARARGEVPQ